MKRSRLIACNGFSDEPIRWRDHQQHHRSPTIIPNDTSPVGVAGKFAPHCSRGGGGGLLMFGIMLAIATLSVLCVMAIWVALVYNR